MIRQPEIEELKKLLNNTDSSVIGISRGFLEDVVQEYEEPSRSELYNQGLNDAWELVKKLWYLGNQKCKEIFGYEFSIDIIEHFTPQEALAKLNAYEETQSKIEVGDVVKYKGCTSEFLVMATSEETFNEQPILRQTKAPYKVMNGSDKDLIKTGKHIDIQSILNQIGGA